METRELLQRAREIQAEQGHSKGYIMDDQGRVCMQGAFLAVGAGVTELAAMILECDRGQELDLAGARALGFTDVCDMCVWNNHPERTLDEVLERFDAGVRAVTPA